MDNKFSRKKIADGVYFSTYKDKRFQKNRIEIRFTDILDNETASLNAIVPAIISRSNNTYKTMKEFNLKLSELYASSICFFEEKNGDVAEFGLYSYSLCNEYAFDGENVLEEIAVIMKDCLFDPYLENGVFPESVVELQKKILIDDNDNEINNKSHYAIRKCNTKAFENEPIAVRINGENDDILKITAESAYKRYKEILETKNVEIICVGPADYSAAERIFTEAFSKITRNPEPAPKSRKSTLKSTPAFVSEKMDIEQNKLILVFKTDYKEWIHSSLMSFMLGGDVSSKLFSVVREKLSLCYYCSASFARNKSSMRVSSGVEAENTEKTRNAVLEQLEELRNGNFTDEDLEKAKLSISNILKTSNDCMESISTWYLSCIDDGEIITPADRIARYQAVTREQIIEAAKAMKLDTVFVLASKEEKE